MTEDGHQQAVAELQQTRLRMVMPDDIRAYTEICFGLAVHLLAIGAQRRHSVHRDNHEGLGRWLRERGHTREADVLSELENIRMGRWYGKQGNGATAKRLDQLLAALEAWAVA